MWNSGDGMVWGRTFLSELWFLHPFFLESPARWLSLSLILTSYCFWFREKMWTSALLSWLKWMVRLESNPPGTNLVPLSCLGAPQHRSCTHPCIPSQDHHQNRSDVKDVKKLQMLNLNQLLLFFSLTTSLSHQRASQAAIPIHLHPFSFQEIKKRWDYKISPWP